MDKITCFYQENGGKSVARDGRLTKEIVSESHNKAVKSKRHVRELSRHSNQGKLKSVLVHYKRYIA